MVTEENFPITTLSVFVSCICIMASMWTYCCVKYGNNLELTRCGLISAVVLAVMTSLYVWLLYDQYIPNGIKNNERIDASVTHCIIYQVEHSVNVVANNIKYIVFFIHLPDNVTNTYDGYCKLTEVCYPEVGMGIPCYPYENSYSNVPHYTDVQRLRDHLAWGYVQLALGCMPMIFLIVGGIKLMHEYCKEQHPLRNIRFPRRIVQPVIQPVVPVPEIAVQIIAEPSMSVLQTETQHGTQVVNHNNNHNNNQSNIVTCSICMLKKPCYMFESCRHVCLCDVCNASYRETKCIICRTHTRRVLVYL
jgi:hypothetical protein